MQQSFGSLELSLRVRRESQLMKVRELIDWESLRPLMKGLYKRDFSHAGGQEPFDSILMLKAILLGQWHSLSDSKLEEALLVRIDFMQFCSLDLSDPVPDETTLCRFRNRLIERERLDKILEQVNEQLQSHGLMIKAASGAVLDATLIESVARPNKTITIQTDEKGAELVYEDGSSPGIVVEEELSADQDATWLKKGKRSTFGYRAYVTVTEDEGYVCGVHTAPANESEMKHFTEAISSVHLPIKRVYTDKGSSSQANRDHLKEQQIKSAIMHRAVRNKTLTPRQKLANRLISKKRYIVEQCFGSLKRLFNIGRASYCTTRKVNAQVILKSICFNLKKAANKIIDLLQNTGKMHPLNR